MCGLIYRILEHPDGFGGEVVIFENGQGRGGFDGLSQGGSVYDAWPEIANAIWVNAEALGSQFKKGMKTSKFCWLLKTQQTPMKSARQPMVHPTIIPEAAAPIMVTAVSFQRRLTRAI